MTGGKPGDNPWNDVIIHEIHTFGDPIDELIREVTALPNFSARRNELQDFLYRFDYRPPRQVKIKWITKRKIKKKLQRMIAELQ